MATLKLDDLLALDVATRLALIAKLWDSIVDDGHVLPLTEHEQRLLAERLKEDDADPDAAISWDMARADLVRSR